MNLQKKYVDSDLGHTPTKASKPEATHVLAWNGERGQKSEVDRADLMLVLAQKAHEHLLERLVEEEHNMVALGSARSPRTPTNLTEKS